MNQGKLSISMNDFFQKQTYLVSILPLFQADTLFFISGEFGPFLPNKPVIVPLWLALYLRVRNKCRISPPDFLDSENIK